MCVWGGGEGRIAWKLCHAGKLDVIRSFFDAPKKWRGGMAPSSPLFRGPCATMITNVNLSCFRTLMN